MASKWIQKADLDIKEVIENNLKSAELGDASLQYDLGLRYTDGFDVKKDMTEAVKWLRKSAEQGFEPAVEKLKELGEWKDN